MMWQRLSVSLFFIIAGCEPQSRTTSFDQGREHVIRGQFEKALPLLQQYLIDQPKGVDASRAGLFLGKAYLGLNRRAEARQAFEDTIRTYPGSLEDHKCRYKLALLDLVEGNLATSRDRFARLAAQPNGPLTAEAAAMRDYLTTQLEQANAE